MLNRRSAGRGSGAPRVSNSLVVALSAMLRAAGNDGVHAVDHPEH
jgi:hypothetical protein